MTHVAESKKTVVSQFASLIEEYPIVGVVNMENLPAKQLQTMRASLRKQGIVLRMTKQRLIYKALESAERKRPGVSKLKEHCTGMPAMIFTKENPFALFKLLKKSQSKAPIRGGQTAPEDIVVPAGPTGFAPGPIIGELGSVGIKTAMVEGKVAVKEESRVAKDGDVVSQKLAAILTRLNITPMRIGLDLVAAYENGEILTKQVLDVDEEAAVKRLVQAHFEAIALAMEAAFPTAETTERLLQKAFMDATILALDRNIVNHDTIKPLLGKAYAMSLALTGLLPDEALSAEAKAAADSVQSAGDTSAAPKEKKEEKKPEEAAAGLGALFG
jgi:large subunit ribosomal protein L10